MNTDGLLAIHDRAVDTPDATARLRRFVFDLAMRGKLVEQNPNDEPASVLLKRIAAEKIRFTKANSRRRIKLEPRISGAEPYELPQNWIWVAFGELHSLVRGVTYSKADVSTEPSERVIPILRANNIGTLLSHEDPVYVNRDRVREDQLLRRGDFMIALSSGSKNLVGKAAYVPDDFDEAFGGFCGVVRLYDLNLVGFVGVYLQSDLYRQRIAAGSRGIGINNLKKEVLANLHFPLPPLSEQSRIVTKVDKLTNLCDQLEEARAARKETRVQLTKATLARLSESDADTATFRSHARFAIGSLPALTARTNQIKYLRRTILDVAVGGKLVKQHPTDEPASELLKRIANEKVRLAKLGEIKKQKTISTVDRDDSDFMLPPGWIIAQLAEISICLDYRRRPINSSERKRRTEGKLQRDLYPYYGATRQQGWIDDYLFDEELVLLGEDGVPFLDPLKPKAYLISGKSWVNNHAHVFKAILVSPKYLMHQLNVFDYTERIVGATRSKLSQGRALDIPIALPPLSEQHRIVAKVDELLGLCDQLEAGLKATNTNRIHLLESTLQEAICDAA